MPALSTAWKILRHLGPEWVAHRIKLEAEARLGILKRRLPISNWDFGSGDWPRSGSIAEPEQLKRSLRERANFFFSSPQAIVPPYPNAVREQANRVLAGELLYFAHKWIEVGFPPDWHLNVFDGTRVASEVHWSHVDLGAIHDVKFVWEPNRFSFAYLLVRAYVATQDERYADAFWVTVEDWADKNPPNSGVNWASGQEAAFRVMAWCFALFAFLQSPSSTAQRVLSLMRMFEWHGKRIAGFLGYALSQRNNHGISEAAGLFTIGVLFPQLARADEWRQLGRKLIIRQLRDQIYNDGSYIQHSFNYQRVMIDDVVWAIRLGELNGSRFPEESYRTLAKSLQFMISFCDPKTGKMPNYGSNDGSLVLPLSSCDYGDYRPSLQAAHYLVYRELLFCDGGWNEQVAWLFGSELQNLKYGETSDSHPGTRSQGNGFAQSAAEGLASGYEKLKARESYAMLRAAQYRDRPSQADQLHLDLWWRGENIACDAGTYLYNGPAPWENALAATSVHNTIAVEGHDQMTRAGRFLWLDWAQSEVIRYNVAGESAVEGWHDGYANFGATYRRSVMGLNEHDCWIVVDDIVGTYSGTARLQWLFPDFEFAWEEDELRLWLQTRAGSFQCCMHPPRGRRATLVRAGQVLSGSLISERTLDIRGWRSLYYGEKQPALSLALESETPIRFISVLAPAEVVLLSVDETQIRLRHGTCECVVALGRGNRTFLDSHLLGHYQT